MKRIIDWFSRLPRQKATDDTDEIKRMRASAEQEKWELQLQKPEVESLVRKLKRRRELNHFGEELQVSFRPRNGHS